MIPIGNTWLRDRYQLNKLMLAHESYLGTRLSTTSERDGRTIGTYPKHYEPKPANDSFAHIEFGLKYDGLELALLRGVFSRVSAADVARVVEQSPTGRYARQIGFLFEFLTGNTLALRTEIGGNYVPALDAERYVTAPAVKVARWRIDDNLLGGCEFSPVVRLTDGVKQGIRRNWRAEVDKVLEGTPPALLYRALSYFYAKETRSSFLIEREEPGRDREQRFTAALREAGKMPAAESVGLARLVSLQNVIVDPRYAEKKFRSVQNYVGQTMPGMREHVHYVCPPPEIVPSLMQGLAKATTRLEAAPASVQAATTAFQFVFVHPFEDGNGRIHRFLLQDVLARRGVVQKGAALPLSATILNDMPGYDAALEAFSKGIMAQAAYTLSATGALTLNNAADVERSWRYPDLTAQVEYLHAVMERTIEKLPEELGYLRNYDRAREEIRGIVDMPDQRLSSLLHCLDAGGGRLSKNKRKQFPELTNSEIERMQAAYADAFAPDTARLSQPSLKESNTKVR